MAFIGSRKKKDKENCFLNAVTDFAEIEINVNEIILKKISEDTTLVINGIQYILYRSSDDKTFNSENPVQYQHDPEISGNLRRRGVNVGNNERDSVIEIQSEDNPEASNIQMYWKDDGFYYESFFNILRKLYRTRNFQFLSVVNIGDIELSICRHLGRKVVFINTYLSGDLFKVKTHIESRSRNTNISLREDMIPIRNAEYNLTLYLLMCFFLMVLRSSSFGIFSFLIRFFVWIRLKYYFVIDFGVILLYIFIFTEEKHSALCWKYKIYFLVLYFILYDILILIINLVF